MPKTINEINDKITKKQAVVVTAEEMTRLVKKEGAAAAACKVDVVTTGIGTRIFLCGGTGYITGAGTQHSPDTGFATLMVQGDLKQMKPRFLKAACFPGYGPTLYVGLGVPIPVLDEETARAAGVSDKEITVPVLDYGIARRE
jgi:uncharacterized protein (DUF39 family)